MRKPFIFFLFFILSIGSYAQERLAKGYVLDKDSRAAIKGVQVLVEGEKTMALTNERGEFIVAVRKGRRHLIFSKDNYTPFTYSLKPGFQRGTIRISLESYKAVNSYAKKRLERDSLFITYKNAISLSIIEFFAVGIGLRYERFLLPKHAVGMHATYYFNGKSSNHYFDPGGYDPVSDYTGVKMAPFYRFYTRRPKAAGVFFDLKVPFGYFDFNNISYRYRTTTHLSASTSANFWSWGFGVSLGIMARLPKTKHGVINFSVGGQYFPMIDIPQTIPLEVSMGGVINLETNTKWWYQTGPGAYFEVKFTIGGIF